MGLLGSKLSWGSTPQEPVLRPSEGCGMKNGERSFVEIQIHVPWPSYRNNIFILCLLMIVVVVSHHHSLQQQQEKMTKA